MSEAVSEVVESLEPAAPSVGAPVPAPRSELPFSRAAALALAASLAACGGGGGESTSSGGTSGGSTGGPGSGTSGGGTGGGTGAALPPTATEASRFLVQASMGANRALIARVQAIGYAAWLDEQFALPLSSTRWDYLVANGFDAATYKNSQTGFDAAAWSKLITSPDTLRQRVTLALSEIMVAAIDGLDGGGWQAFAGAAYLDLLEANAFGNHRTLLQLVSTNAAMGEYLTFRANNKANATTGALPDENYARELMQLFTIGLVQLNLDGTPKLTGGVATYTYTQDDVTGLARVFTGWDFDLAGQTAAVATATPDFIRRPMTQVASRHELGAKTFLGTTIPAGTAGAQSLQLALDAIFAHANIAPFMSRQLIQRLVTSNPSPAYVARIAAVFNDDGSGVRGNLKAVLRALLLDDEARSASGTTSTSFGKLREPIVRLTAWARAWTAASATNAWAIGNTSDASTRLGQSPLRSPSVFNFFRPGYVPPDTGIASAALVAPEFQITNESSVVGYVNFMQRVVAGGVGDVKADYTGLLALADDAAALVAEIALVLAADALAAATRTTLSTALASMPTGTATTRQNRVNAGVLLVLAAPEFIVQK